MGNNEHKVALTFIDDFIRAVPFKLYFGMCTCLGANSVYIKTMFYICKRVMNSCGIIKFVGANFRGLLKFYRFVGTYFRVISYSYKRKYDLFTFTYELVEDDILWIRGTHEIQEN